MARNLRDLRIAARDGDHAAIRALLRRDGLVELAKDVHRGKPIAEGTQAGCRPLPRRRHPRSTW
jgi:hypothetical protein